MQNLFSNTLRAVVVAGVTVLSLAAPEQARAAEGSIEIELNRLQQVEGGCRLIVVFTNLLEVQIDSLEVETVLFDHDGQADRFLILKSQPLAPRKVRVHQYDLAAADCASVGSILINDVVGCAGEGLTPALCLARIAPSSRETASLYISAPDPAAAAAPSPSQ